VISVKIKIQGTKVQGIGYRIFLLEKALENGIERIYARNLDKDKVELLLSDEEDKIDSFFEIINKEKPEAAEVNSIKRESYKGRMSIPTIDKYCQHLILEQLGRGREELVNLPEIVSKNLGEKIDPVVSSLKGIDEKFGNMIEKFGLFGRYATDMDEKLTSVDKKLTGMGDTLKGIDTKLDKITTLPEKIDTLSERIVEAVGATKKKSKR